MLVVRVCIKALCRLLGIMVSEWADAACNTTEIASVLAYEAIKHGRNLNYRAVFEKVNIITKELIGFPCKPR